jgi:transcriptional regulator GlxA family with amidase domain
VRADPSKIDVVFVLLPTTVLLDLAGPAEAFRLANEKAGVERFRLRFAGATRTIDCSVGLELGRLETLPVRFARPTWIVLCGCESSQRDRWPAWRQTARWLGQTVLPLLEPAREHKVLAVCSGTLLAAESGLVGTRRVTTHHELLGELAELAPRAEVVRGRVFVEDGPLSSSAGITAGIDLALHHIAVELGDAVAAAVAQSMVVYLRRGPHDPELSPYLAHRNHIHAVVHRVQNAILAAPSVDWDVAAMARVARLQPRHLGRLFLRHAGLSPLAYLVGIRVERARRALEGGASVTAAAEAAGFRSDVALRRAWSRHAGGTPSQARSPS